MNNTVLPPNLEFPIVSASIAGETDAWAQLILRYATGSGNSLITHIATVDVMVGANSSACDFDASAIIGPGVKGP